MSMNNGLVQYEALCSVVYEQPSNQLRGKHNSYNAFDVLNCLLAVSIVNSLRSTLPVLKAFIVHCLSRTRSHRSHDRSRLCRTGKQLS